MVILGVIVRVPFWIEALKTPLDGDGAVLGLMARHPLASVTMWGQPYGSPVEAWMIAPLVAWMGMRMEAIRLGHFLLGLALIPLAWGLARAVHPRAALPAALVIACPPSYFLLLAAMPPPLYPAALLLGGGVLLAALHARSGRAPLVGWGVLSGLALWTHLMTATAVIPTGLYLARQRGRALIWGLVPLALASAPYWSIALPSAQARSVVSVSGRRATLAEHLGEVGPGLPGAVLSVLGARSPILADDPDAIASAPPAVALGLALAYGILVLLTARASRLRGAPGLLLVTAALAVAAFPFPLRSHPSTLRFLTPLYLPLVAALLWLPARNSARRAWVVALLLASLHLGGALPLLGALRAADRREAPFLLDDLRPLRDVLLSRGIRRAYASYGPAWRLTFESGEQIVASPPWNERFLHHPLPLLDEVRFARGVAWVLTPHLPSDLPPIPAFTAALGATGGTWTRTSVGRAVVFHGFAPPFAPDVMACPGAGAAGDLDPRTALSPDPEAPLVLRFPAPLALDGLTLLAGAAGPRLLRSMDVEVSADGVAFERVAERRRRGERADLRFVNGHPQYVIDDDVLAIPLRGRPVAALRVTPIASTDPWTLGEILLHPAAPDPLRPWDEWLDPHLSWAERKARLLAEPRPQREDWHTRLLLALRHESYRQPVAGPGSDPRR